MSFRSTRLSMMTWTAQILLIIPTWRTQIWSRLCQIRTVRMKVPHQRPTTIWIVIPSPLCTRVVWNIFYQHTVYIVASSATKLILNGVFQMCVYIFIYILLSPQTVIYSFGHFVQYVSPAGDCEWLWTKPDSDQIQHRARDFFYGFQQRQTQSFSKASHMSQIKLRRPQLQKIQSNMFLKKVRLFDPQFYYLFYLHGFKYLYLPRRKMYVICCALGTTSIFLSQQVISEMQYVNNEKSKISMVSHKEISECEHDSPCLLELKYIW